MLQIFRMFRERENSVELLGSDTYKIRCQNVESMALALSIITGICWSECKAKDDGEKKKHISICRSVLECRK
jgi:hypothetical protein